eukprot:g16376.t2
MQGIIRQGFTLASCTMQMDSMTVLWKPSTGVFQQMKLFMRTALVDFDAVIQLEPQKGRHYYNRGVVYHRMGREEDAIEDLSRAIDLGSTEAAVFSERGLAWRSFGNMAQAVIDLTAAIEADGTQTLYLSNRGQCLFEQGLYDRAEADLSRALQIDGRDAELLYRRGITRYAQRHYAESIADLKAALSQALPCKHNQLPIYVVARGQSQDTRQRCTIISVSPMPTWASISSTSGCNFDTGSE